MSGFGQKNVNNKQDILKSIKDNCISVTENNKNIIEISKQDVHVLTEMQQSIKKLESDLIKQAEITKVPTAGTTPYLDLLFMLPNLFMNYPVQMLVGTGLSIGAIYGLKKFSESASNSNLSAPTTTNITINNITKSIEDV